MKKIQNEKNLTIGRIRSDKGTQFTNNKVIRFCSDLGITHEFSIVGTL